jgi:McrBC 5-methylcytosine restriction system component
MTADASLRAEVAPYASLRVQVAPDGRTSGFGYFRPDGAELTVTVTPKLWGTGQPVLRTVTWDGRSPVQVHVHESDQIRFVGSRAALARLALALSAAGPQDAPLLRIVPPAVAVPPDAGRPAGLAALLDLFELADRSRARLAPDLLAAEPLHHPVLRALTHRRFVSAVEPQLARVRPRYREVVETLAAPRGRFLDRSLAEATVTRVPALACRYDDHTVDSPLLQVIVAALRVVATAAPVRHGSDLTEASRQRAAGLVRHLATVTVLPRAGALRLSGLVRLSALERSWSDALLLARQVLADTTQAPTGTGPPAPALCLTVPTAKLWEQVLAQVLRGVYGDVRISADNATAPGVHAPPPWAADSGPGPGGRYPDFMAVLDGTPHCLDAKYSWFGTGPAVSDADQMFAYSHLATLDGRPVGLCALLYPTAPGTAVSLVQTLRRLPGRDLPLLVIQLPFPAPGQARGPAWERYVGQLSVQLRGVLAEHGESTAGSPQAG